MRAPGAWCMLADVLGVVLGLAVLARAGELDGEASVDVLHAGSTSDEAGAGAPETLTATELGFRIRAGLRELDDRFRFDLDYRDREPIAGDFPNAPLHLLYRAEARYEVVEDALTVGLGRFVAPAAILTPVDGAELSWTPGDWALAAYGGRRGFSQSRRNLPLGTFLPAVGGSVGWAGSRADATLLGGWSQDQVPLVAAGDVVETLGAAHVVARGSAMPKDPVRIGAQLAMVQQATWVLGPTWSDLAPEATALDLWQGLVWADWEPTDWLQLGADVHHQRVGAWQTATVDGAGVEVVAIEPWLTDNRLRAEVATWDHGWVRPEIRLRLLPEGAAEARYGSSVQLTDLGVAGPFVAGRLFVDQVSDSASDRLIWSASGGWERGILEVEAGASFIERDAGPYSGRRSDGSPGEDLSPFVLEAQKVGFVRGFVSAHRWFAGLDLERSLVDPEMRVFAQVGALGVLGW